MMAKSVTRNRNRLVAILLLAAALRAVTLFSVELWRDEIWSMNWSRQDITIELNHTLHLALVAPLTRTMPDVVGIRILSYWLGLIAVAATARIGYRIGGWCVSMIAALLVTISPYLIAYSQEGRDYMLAVALVTLGIKFWLESRWWLSTLFLLGGILSVGASILIVLAIDIATGMALITRQSRGLPRRFHIATWLESHGLLYVAAIGLNVLVARSLAGAYLPIVTNEAVSKFLFRYIGLAQCGDGGAELLPCLTLGLMLWPVLIIGSVLLWRSKRLGYHGWLMLWVVVIPVAAAALLHAMNYGIFVQRHMIMTLPALACLWAIVLVRWRRWTPILLTIMLVQSVMALSYYYQANPYKPNWRHIAAYMEAHRQPHEPILVQPVLLDMLAEEARYHFKIPIFTLNGNSPTSPYWFISLNLDGIPSGCMRVPDAGERGVFLFHCEGDT